MNKTEWLLARKKHIGASEVGDILDGKAFEVWADKVSPNVSDKDERWFRMGHKAEGMIADEVGYLTGYEVQNPGSTEILYHPELPFIGATRDRIIKIPEIGWIPLECKYIGTFMVNPDDWRIDPPTKNIVQLYIQSDCMETDKGMLAGMFNGYRLEYAIHDKDDELLSMAYELLEEFWWHVKTKTPPEPDRWSDLSVTKNMWNKDNGETITFDNDDMELVERLELEKEERNAAEKKAAVLEARLRERMREATFARLPDGRLLTLKTQKKKGYTVTFEPTEYRVLRIPKKGK